MALNVLSWTMMIGGGLSSLLGVLGIGEKIAMAVSNREASLNEGLKVYKVFFLMRQSTYLKGWISLNFFLRFHFDFLPLSFSRSLSFACKLISFLF